MNRNKKGYDCKQRVTKRGNPSTSFAPELTRCDPSNQHPVFYKMATSDVRAKRLTTALNSARGANILDQNDADDVEALIINYCATPATDEVGDNVEEDENEDEDESVDTRDTPHSTHEDNDDAEESSDSNSDDEGLVDTCVFVCVHVCMCVCV